MNNFISNYANIPNPITKFFNKLDSISLYGNYSKMVVSLEAIKRVPLYVKNISICSDNAEELENLTDPNLHNTPIDNLKIILKSFNISSKTIENLQTIYPNSITLFAYSETKNEYAKQVLFENFIKLFPKLDRTSLMMYFDTSSSGFALEFSDVIFKVVESKEECLYIRAKSVEIRCKDEELCWIK